MYSKDSYNYGRHGRKRRLKPISVIITLLVIILISGGLYFLLFNGKNKYEDYTTYNTNNKQYGTVKHYEKDNDQFYVSLYYPKVKEKNLSGIIKESYTTYLKSEKKKKDQKDILYLDYSCKKIYKQYVVVELDYKRINEDETKTKATKSIMTYDCKTNQLVALKDCLHGKYGDLLNTLGVNEYNKESTLIKVDKDSFTYYTDDT